MQIKHELFIVNLKKKYQNHFSCSLNRFTAHVQCSVFA